MTWGGKRTGSGRPRGEPSVVLRVPSSRVGDVKALLAGNSHTAKLPLYASSVRAGFPSPADDYIESMLDLNEYLVQHPAATFLVTASGDSMQNAGIQSGDLLIVDRSLEASHGKIVIAALDGELTVKRLSKKNGCVQLIPENADYQPIDITREADLVIWGVVTHIIRRAE
ncbi:LexA family protein [Legionella dresdenensis]|uniref:LexA family protein n=1 Tax=Legionella dresdenensis TaxID=450200 RepID=A0ABV8CG43_9GAMM